MSSLATYSGVRCRPERRRIPDSVRSYIFGYIRSDKGCGSVPAGQVKVSGPGTVDVGVRGFAIPRRLRSPAARDPFLAKRWELRRRIVIRPGSSALRPGRSTRRSGMPSSRTTTPRPRLVQNERFLSEAREAYDEHVAPGAGDDAKRRRGVASGSAHRTAQALFTMAHSSQTGLAQLEAATDISDRWIRESGAEQALENPAGRPNDKAPNGNVRAASNYLAMVCRVSAQMVAGAIGGSSGALRGRRTARRSERNNGSATTTIMPRMPMTRGMDRDVGGRGELEHSFLATPVRQEPARSRTSMIPTA